MLTGNADAVCASRKRMDRFHPFRLERLFDIRGRWRHVVIADAHSERLCLPRHLALD